MIGNLVHSSPNIKKEVLLAGALQPVIGLLRYDQILDSHYCCMILVSLVLMLSTTYAVKDKIHFVLQLLMFLYCKTVPAALRVKGRQLYCLDNLLQLILIARWIRYMPFALIFMPGGKNATLFKCQEVKGS